MNEDIHYILDYLNIKYKYLYIENDKPCILQFHLGYATFRLYMNSFIIMKKESICSTNKYKFKDILEYV